MVGLGDERAIRALVDLLGNLFDVSELRAFIRMGPDGAAVTDALPGAIEVPAQVRLAAVLALQHRALINKAFFDHLRSERPKRSGEIDAVEVQWQHIPQGQGVGVTVARGAAGPVLVLDAPGRHGTTSTVAAGRAVELRAPGMAMRFQTHQGRGRLLIVGDADLVGLTLTIQIGGVATTVTLGEVTDSLESGLLGGDLVLLDLRAQWE